MPKNSRKARAQHARNHKRAANRQAAHNNRHSGRKTLSAAQRAGGSISWKSFMQRMMPNRNGDDQAAGPKPIIQYSQRSRRHQKTPAGN